ncbi:unnamed protein product [Wuchereria bancrofti]|uniref:Uncharacterized protein n=1 Tax=Wuchereria bancrofti TaxID=6293 RepID=A0A3P7EB22_WUCBA|nr:unnamed protein product [Wuchereria bancrofti]
MWDVRLRRCHYEAISEHFELHLKGCLCGQCFSSISWSNYTLKYCPPRSHQVRHPHSKSEDDTLLPALEMTPCHIIAAALRRIFANSEEIHTTEMIL